MTEGIRHSVSYPQFRWLFGCGSGDLNRPKIHNEIALPPKDTKFMYPPRDEGLFGTVTGMYTYTYDSYLNRMFRRTLTPKDGDSMNITFYTKNLHAQMASNALSFSVFNFIWEEIKSISQSPLRNCDYASFLLYMIENVTQTQSVKDIKHKPLRIIRVKDPIMHR